MGQFVSENETFSDDYYVFIAEHQYTSWLVTKWWNHNVLMKKSHTSVLSGAARVIIEDWWRLVTAPWLQATEWKRETPLKYNICSTHPPHLSIYLSICLSSPPFPLFSLLSWHCSIISTCAQPCVASQSFSSPVAAPSSQQLENPMMTHPQTC